MSYPIRHRRRRWSPPPVWKAGLVAIAVVIVVVALWRLL